MFPETHANAMARHDLTDAEMGPTLPNAGAPEPASLLADGSEETLSDVDDIEEDVRDYDLGVGD